jgi:hypothetical protein
LDYGLSVASLLTIAELEAQVLAAGAQAKGATMPRFSSV